MKILFIGDIVGRPGRDAVNKLLPLIRKEEGIGFVIANAENAVGGSGINQKVAQELFNSGVDVLTSGDHIWKKKEIFDIIGSEKRLLRPLNYPANAPGSGWGVFRVNEFIKVGVINLLGRVFMEALECPFRTVSQAIEKISSETKIIIVDIHAEATSEKIALGWYLDGKASAVLGTHTHVQTADEKILPRGTAYITDVGMTGPYDSVIGRGKESVLSRFIDCIPCRFEVAQDDIQLHGVIVDVAEDSGRARKISRVQKKLF
ncbi:MAG: TIGR00282 family metallophosphoesterase [Candidatus Omnitrophota bacterium]|nr:TIGR00282 family metallophosphoesterase [Candidatus Omnitrophota bacterium]